MDALEELKRMEQESKEIEARMTKTEEEGLKNTLKHFDRIHDKLFTFNNILIAAYFALTKLSSLSVMTILIPLSNLAFLIFIEYRMMEKSRFESNIKSQPLAAIQRYGRGIAVTNLYSLAMIFTTFLVTLVFVYYLVKTN